MTDTVTHAPILPPSAVPSLNASENLVGYWRDCADPFDPSGSDAKRLAKTLNDLEKAKAGTLGYRVHPHYEPGAMVAYLEREVDKYRRRVDHQAVLPWPGDHCDPDMPAAERERIAAALDDGEVISRWMGCSFDRLDNSIGMLGSRCLGRAGYRWPDGLSHYVRRYGLRLDPAFLAAIGAV